jgi:biopolymer transport protein ExbD
MRTWPARSRKPVRIEIIPMIDVMMFLLVFFVLISIHVLPALGLKVVLPHSAAPARIDELKRVTVTMTSDGSIYLDGEKTSLQQLPEQLHSLQAKSKIAVIIAGDEHSMLQQLVEVLDAMKRADVPAASIVTKPKSP